MKCVACGSENPEGMKFCGACGRPLEVAKAAVTPVKDRYCVSCGRVIPWEANVCQYCGHDYRARPKEEAKETDNLLVGSILTILAGVLSMLFVTLAVVDIDGIGNRETVLIVMVYAFAVLAVLGGISGLARMSFPFSVFGAACGIVGPAFFFGIPGLVLMAKSAREFEKG